LSKFRPTSINKDNKEIHYQKWRLQRRFARKWRLQRRFAQILQS